MSRSAARKTPPPEPDPFRYGWRFIKKVLPDGTTDLVQVPLTLEDVLHPQEGDEIPDRPLQSQDAEYLGPIFRTRAQQRLPGALVLVGCLVNWGVPGIRNHSPDLSVFEGVTNPPGLEIGTFRLRACGGHCVLAMEIVSPDTRVNDVFHKFREYHRVGVPLYVLIDQRTDGGPRQVIGYRYMRQRYVKMRLDQQGRLLLKPLGLWLGLEHDRAVCYDADTGERFGDHEQVQQERIAAKQRTREQADSREAAEQAARQQADARKAADQRVRELEAGTRRLRRRTSR
jgi:Uma2 family endonuclease